MAGHIVGATRGNTMACQEAGGAGSKCGQEPLLWLGLVNLRKVSRLLGVGP